MSHTRASKRFSNEPTTHLYCLGPGSRKGQNCNTYLGRADRRLVWKGVLDTWGMAEEVSMNGSGIVDRKACTRCKRINLFALEA